MPSAACQTKSSMTRGCCPLACAVLVLDGEMLGLARVTA